MRAEFGESIGVTDECVRKARAAYLTNRRVQRHFDTLLRPDQRWNILLVLYVLDATDRRPTGSNDRPNA